MENNVENKPTCPKCGSENINFQAVPVISQKKGKTLLWWLFIGWWWVIIEFILWFFLTLPMLIATIIDHKEIRTKVKVYAVCQNCGYGWKVKHKKSRKVNLIRIFITIIFILLCFFFGIPLNQNDGNSTTNDPNTIYTQAAEAVYMGMTQTAGTNPDAIFTQVAATIMAENHREPSATSVPIEVETNTELSDYYTRKYLQLNQCTSSNDTLTGYFTYLSEDISALFDSSFMELVHNELEELKKSCTNFYEESVPSELTKVNEYLGMVDQEYLAFYNDVVYWLETYDSGYSDSAVTHMNNAANYFSLATDELDKLNE